MSVFGNLVPVWESGVSFGSWGGGVWEARLASFGIWRVLESDEFWNLASFGIWRVVESRVFLESGEF